MTVKVDYHNLVESDDAVLSEEFDGDCVEVEGEWLRITKASDKHYMALVNSHLVRSATVIRAFAEFEIPS